MEARIVGASITTGVGPRDRHLRSADFLDVERHPFITFQSTSIERADDGYRITGSLTIAGETHPVVLEAVYRGVAPDQAGARRATLSARTQINWTNWGLKGAGLFVGKELTILIEATAVEAGAARRAA